MRINRFPTQFHLKFLYKIVPIKFLLYYLVRVFVWERQQFTLGFSSTIVAAAEVLRLCHPRLRPWPMSTDISEYFVLFQPLCSTDPMLVLEFSMLVLESCPTQTIELFLSGNIPADLVNSYLKQHAPNMQTTYLELMLAMNENSISGSLQSEMVRIFFLL